MHGESPIFTFSTFAPRKGDFIKMTLKMILEEFATMVDWMNINSSDVFEQERILSYISIPIGSFGTLISSIILIGVLQSAFRDDGVPMRVVLESFGFISSIFGFLFGIYGLVFLDQRAEWSNGWIRQENFKEFWAMMFIFHRFFLIGIDLFPSIDRCGAVMLPMRYYTRASQKNGLCKY